MVKYQITPNHIFNINDFKNAFINFLYAKKNDQNLVFLVDDYDVENLVNGEEKNIVAILQKFGVEFYQTIYSSENLSFHQTFGMQLTTAGHLFSCFCKETKEPYDEACLKLSDYEVLDNQSVSQMRMRKDKKGIIDDNFVVLDFKKSPTKIFSTSINDMIYDINFITYENQENKDIVKEEYIWKLINYNANVNFCKVPTITSNTSLVELFEEKILPDSLGFYIYAKLFNKDLNNIIPICDIVKEDIDFNSLSFAQIDFDKQELIEINNKMVNKITD
jgi:hypothetical protein